MPRWITCKPCVSQIDYTELTLIESHRAVLVIILLCNICLATARLPESTTRGVDRQSGQSSTASPESDSEPDDEATTFRNNARGMQMP